MNSKRNIRKTSHRRKRILLGFLALALGGGIAFLLRSQRGTPSGPSSDTTELPEPGTTPEVGLASPTSGIGTPDQDTDEADDPSLSGEFVDEFTYLARTDPRAAADLLTRLNSGEDRDEKLAILLSTWAESDPAAAAAWVAAIPGGEFRDDATGRLLVHWGEADPLAASAWVLANIESGRKPSGTSTFASAWTRSDPEAAIAWASAIEDASAKKEAFGAIAYQLGLDDPARAGAWIASLDDPDLQDALTTGLISTWATKDPAAAAAWLDAGGLSNASERVHRKASLMLISQWTIDDPRPASMWINSLAEGPLKENAKVALAQTLASEAPGDALIWADAILDDSERNDVVLSIYEDWVEGDPAEFKKQLVQSWSSITDPKVREGIYSLLYDYDPSFKDEVIQLIEKSVRE